VLVETGIVSWNCADLYDRSGLKSRYDLTPKKIMQFEHSYMIDLTKRSAYALQFGALAGGMKNSEVFQNALWELEPAPRVP